MYNPDISKVTEKIKLLYKLYSKNIFDNQIITTNKRGISGVYEINKMIQEAKKFGHGILFIVNGDKVVRDILF